MKRREGGSTRGGSHGAVPPDGMQKWYLYDIDTPGSGKHRVSFEADEFPTRESVEEYCRKAHWSCTYAGVLTEPQLGEPVLREGREFPTEAYQEMFGEISLPEGFEDGLRARDLPGQMDCYRITETAALASTAYGEVVRSEYFDSSAKLQDYPGLVNLIVKDGLLVGARIRSWPNETSPLLPYGKACTYYASDNDGSGSRDREDNAWLICVP